MTEKTNSANSISFFYTFRKQETSPHCSTNKPTHQPKQEIRKSEGMAGRKRNAKPPLFMNKQGRPQLHISQLEINLTVQESPPIARKLALQLLLRQRLKLLLRDGIEIDLSQALTNSVGNALVAWALGDEAGEIVGRSRARLSDTVTVG